MSSADNIWVDPVRLRKSVASVLLAMGSEATEATTVAAHLVEANLAGHDSHGVGMLPTYSESLAQGVLQTNVSGIPIVDDSCFLVIDAQRGFGQSIVERWMNEALERAANSGVCLLAVRNSHHMGRIGHYGEQCIARSMAGIFFTNVVSRPLVVPHGGTRPKLGTNPICVAIPGFGADSFLLDFATSGIAVGKARVARQRGEQLAPGFLLSPLGVPTTDPAVMYTQPSGGLLPIGGMHGHKGYGLALATEVLAAVMTGGPTMASDKLQVGILNSLFCIVYDPKRLALPASPGESIEELMAYLASGEPAGSVMMPGEPERRSRDERENGFGVEAATWSELQKVCVAHGLDSSVIADAALVQRR